MVADLTDRARASHHGPNVRSVLQVRPMTLTSRLKPLVPKPVWRRMRHGKHVVLGRSRQLAEAAGLLLNRRADCYAPTPSETRLRQTVERWAKPSALAGVAYDLDLMQARFETLCERHLSSFLALPPHAELVAAGFGPGYPEVDAFCLFAQLREHRPRRYLEVGSGLSTYYAHLSLGEAPTRITCIEPAPYAALQALEGIELLPSEVQDVPLEQFLSLEPGDVLFIDSSHMVRIDGDVPFLCLEVLPRLRPGVVIHIHDMPFPYNVPYPPDYWTLLSRADAPHWPMFWNEAMLVQALLCNNPAFEVWLSCPLLRFHREEVLSQRLPFYASVAERPDTFSSLWLVKR